MKQAGKAHWLTIAGIVSVAVVLGLFLFAKDSAATTANDFMYALGKGDVDKLTELSFYQGASKSELKDKWKFTVQEVGPHYMFAWKIVGVSKSSEDSGAVTMMVVRNFDQGGYEEKYQLPLVKEGDDWKVDVRAINRGLYPGLPR